MKQLFTIVTFIILSSFCYSQKEDTLLFKAYKSKSLTHLEEFFGHWSNNIQPITAFEFRRLNDTVQNFYSAFKCFYNPFDIGRSGGSEWGNEIYKGVKYLIVQDKVYYGFVDTLDKNLLIQAKLSHYAKTDTVHYAKLISRYMEDSASFINRFFNWPSPKSHDTLDNFRPRLEFNDVKGVILTDEYERLLNRFLGNNHYKFARKSIMSPARSKGESEKRQHFLENCIKIWYGHWGGYWQLYSYPKVSMITFDPMFENAVIDFRMVYEGGYAYLKKINGIWNLIEAKRTWIE